MSKIIGNGISRTPGGGGVKVAPARSPIDTKI